MSVNDERGRNAALVEMRIERARQNCRARSSAEGREGRVQTLTITKVHLRGEGVEDAAVRHTSRQLQL